MIFTPLAIIGYKIINKIWPRFFMDDEKRRELEELERKNNPKIEEKEKAEYEEVAKTDRTMDQSQNNSGSFNDIQAD
jgi:hypothetical protein